MGIKYIWDTNTVIYYLQQQFPLKAEQFMDSIADQFPPAISAITEIELLCWKTPTKKDMEVLYSFITDAMVLELEQPIKYKTADIRKQHRIKLPDAIIAATAITNNLTLITRNTKDFMKIKGLEVVNPFEMR